MPSSMHIADFVTMLAEAGPIGIAAVALAEKFFPMMPSYVVFVFLGMMAASGESELVVTVAATATGSTIGALAWYGLGLALGAKRIEALIERFGRFIILKPALYHRMAGAYRRNHSSGSRLWGRPFPRCGSISPFRPVCSILRS
jgi:membrane protein DedA with SNARE-associated domain